MDLKKRVFDIFIGIILSPAFPYLILPNINVELIFDSVNIQILTDACLKSIMPLRNILKHMEWKTL